MVGTVHLHTNIVKLHVHNYTQSFIMSQIDKYTCESVDKTYLYNDDVHVVH